MPQTYPEAPGYRDDVSSRDAASVIAVQTNILQGAVIEALSIRPMTSWEIATATGMDFQNIQPRVSELLKKGIIRWNGERRQSGRSQVHVKVWEIVREAN